MKSTVSFVFATIISSAFAQQTSTCVQGDRFFFQNVELLSFAAAQSSCTVSGGNLARIANEAELSAVQGMTFGTNAWIGIDARTFGSLGDPFQFFFTDGVTEGVEFFRVPVGSRPWQSGEPNDSNGFEDCVHMNTNGLFNDLGCANNLNYVCRVVNDPSCFAFSVSPSNIPTINPSVSPSNIPTGAPSGDLSISPTRDPTVQPSVSPSNIPTGAPSGDLSISPTRNPTVQPSVSPSKVETAKPTASPTDVIAEAPTATADEEELGFLEYAILVVIALIATVCLIIVFMVTSWLRKKCCKTPVMAELVPATKKPEDGGPIFKVDI